MAFIQFKLDRSINQTRGIFNKYIYETDADTMAEAQATDYFIQSRFKEIDAPDTNGMGWVGGIIECECSDGYFIGRVQADGNTLANIANGGGFDSRLEVTVDGTTYTVTGNESRIFALNGASIIFPEANTVIFPNIRIRTLSGSGPTGLSTQGSATIEVSSIPVDAAAVLGQRSDANEWLEVT